MKNIYTFDVSSFPKQWKLYIICTNFAKSKLPNRTEPDPDPDCCFTQSGLTREGAGGGRPLADWTRPVHQAIHPQVRMERSGPHKGNILRRTCATSGLTINTNSSQQLPLSLCSHFAPLSFLGFSKPPLSLLAIRQWRSPSPISTQKQASNLSTNSSLEKHTSLGKHLNLSSLYFSF